MFQVPEGMSLAEASSGVVGLQSSELIQEIALDPALSLWVVCSPLEVWYIRLESQYMRCDV